MGVKPVGREVMGLVLEILFPTRGLKTPAQVQFPSTQMRKPRPRKAKWFTQGHQSGSGQSQGQKPVLAGCSQSGRTASAFKLWLGSHGVFVLHLSLTCFPPPFDIPWLASDPPPLHFADKAAKVSEGPGDRVWLPECPALGTGWRETRIRDCFPLPQACPLAAVWVDPDTLGIAKWTERPRLPQIPIRKGLLEGVEPGKDFTKVFTSEHTRY